MHIRILAIGTRGDVQPYVALGLGLQQAGFEVSLATTANFRAFVEGRGLPCLTGEADMQAIMQSQAGQHTAAAGRNIPRLLRQNILLSNMPTLLRDAWRLSQGADVLLYSAIGRFATPHIAERLGIPAIPAFLQPLLHPSPEVTPIMARQRFSKGPDRLARQWPSRGPDRLAHQISLQGAYNLLTHHIFEQISWAATRQAINTFRCDTLGLAPVARGGPYRTLRTQHTPTLYAYSPAVVPKPADWPAEVHVPGYWFLDHAADYQPDPALAAFLAAGPPPVYIGFGSMTATDPQETLRLLMAAIDRAKVRAIIAAGWAELSSVALPATVLIIPGAPHDWLFPQMAAVVHHGGAGTTAAGLRAGIPSVIVPHFADQFFWAERVRDLGVGPDPIPRRKLTPENLAYALRLAQDHAPLRQRAADLGVRIRAEDGVGTAVAIIDDLVQDRAIRRPSPPVLRTIK